MEKNTYANRKIRKDSNSRFRKFKDEYELQYLSKRKPLEEHYTLEKKLEVIKKNFDISDKQFEKYSFIKSQLNNGNLLKGEFMRYQKELNKIKNEISDIFKKTWHDLNRYGYDLPSSTFKLYRQRYKNYNYDITRNTFNKP